MYDNYTTKTMFLSYISTHSNARDFGSRRRERFRSQRKLTRATWRRINFEGVRDDLLTLHSF